MTNFKFVLKIRKVFRLEVFLDIVWDNSVYIKK